MIKTTEKSRILVTGGAGFIGSNLTRQLLQSGHEVVVLDNFSTGKRKNILPFLSAPAFTLIEGDIRDLEICRKAAEKCSIVFHEAALGSVPRSIASPQESAAVNISGFINILLAARDAGVRRVVYASSSSVYGDADCRKKVENKIGRQLSPYAITKYADELFARNFADIYKMDIIGLRYFNVFGRHQDPDGPYAAVIPRFISKLLNGEAPVINGDGTYSRDFTFVDNVVDANILAAAYPENTSGEIFNIAGGENTSLNELFQLLKENLSAFLPGIGDITAEYGPCRPGDIPHSLADISKAASLLGYRPAVNVREGLKQTARWYFENKEYFIQE